MGGSGYLAALYSPRYRDSVERTAPQTDPGDTQRQTPARTGTIWGSLFRGYPRSYQVLAGGLDQLAELGNTDHPITPWPLPYQQGFIRPADAGPQCFAPRLSAFINRGLGAAFSGRSLGASIWGSGAGVVLPVERIMAVPIARFWDQFPNTPDMPWIRRQPGYVTGWPAAQMTYKTMGPNGG